MFSNHPMISHGQIWNRNTWKPTLVDLNSFVEASRLVGLVFKAAVAGVAVKESDVDFIQGSREGKPGEDERNRCCFADSISSRSLDGVIERTGNLFQDHSASRIGFDGYFEGTWKVWKKSSGLKMTSQKMFDLSPVHMVMLRSWNWRSSMISSTDLLRRFDCWENPDPLSTCS